VPLPVLIALAAFVIGAIVLNRTRFGQSVFAIGGSEDARPSWVCRCAASRSRCTSGARCSPGSPACSSPPGLDRRADRGYGLELQAIAAVVIGGTLLTGGYGTMSGTLPGVALLAVVQNLINQVGTLSQYYQDVVSGAFLLTVVLLQTVLGRRRRL
jgi:ribose transport system permease protein